MTIHILTESLVHKSKLLKSIITSIAKLEELVSGTKLLKEMYKKINRLFLPHERDLKELLNLNVLMTQNLHGATHSKI